MGILETDSDGGHATGGDSLRRTDPVALGAEHLRREALLVVMRRRVAELGQLRSTLFAAVEYHDSLPDALRYAVRIAVAGDELAGVIEELQVLRARLPFRVVE